MSTANLGDGSEDRRALRGAALSAGAVVVAAAVAGALAALIRAEWLVAVASVGVAAGATVFLLHRWKVYQYEATRVAAAEARQAQALIALAPLGFSLPLPWSSWAIGPDAAFEIVKEVLGRRPRAVLECGAGVSTLIVARCLERLGHGRVWSLEQEEKWAREADGHLARHGLSEWATVIHAPLRPIHPEAEGRPWYDFGSSLDGVPPIDLLIVDGPAVGFTGPPLTRLPALAILWKRLAPEAAIIVDDGNRAGEREIVRRWRAAYPNLAVEYRETTQGMWVLRKSEAR